ncbi:unnamed protein product [Rhizophagus irregularis]|uniref:Uncharacterized protein n=1 Tax=Rhizophagus irregularis TaxID=588596 RepID=A0A916EGM2_9GLOM|nr:unnamed protein product [Rhizophagus irregularis]
MIFSLNCLFLRKASIRSIPVIISEETTVGYSRIKYEDITVSHVKLLFLYGKKISYPLDHLNLWKVDPVSANKYDKELEKFSTENDIKEKLGGELMNPQFPLTSSSKEIIEVIKKNALKGLPRLPDVLSMPLQQRNFEEAMCYVKETIYNNITGRDGKSNYWCIVSEGAPGIGIVSLYFS